MIALVNTILMLDFILAYLAAYRISWAANVGVDYPPAYMAARRVARLSYFAMMSSVFLSLLMILAHLTLTVILVVAPESTWVFLALASIIFVLTCLVYWRIPSNPK